MKKTVLLLLMVLMLFAACHGNRSEINPLDTNKGADDWVNTPNTKGYVKTSVM